MSAPARRVRVGADSLPAGVLSPSDETRLTAIGERLRPSILARDELTPVLGAFYGAFGSAGIRQGSTVVIESAGPAGATSVALALLAAATTAGRWCAVVGLSSVGLVAATELGLCLDRLAIVPEPSSRPAKVLAALLEGCDIVLVAGWAYPNLGETRRLAALARERRSILLPLRVGPSGPLGRWPEPPDVALRVVGSRPVGIGQGEGRLSSRLVEIETTRRRASPRTVLHTIWLPSPDGSVVSGDPSQLPVAARDYR
jgi:hypothetical protein